MDNPAELLTIADTIETNGGWHIAAFKVRAAADRIRELEAALRKIILDCETRRIPPTIQTAQAALAGDRSAMDREGEPT